MRESTLTFPEAKSIPKHEDHEDHLLLQDACVEMSSLLISIHVLLLCTSLWLSASPGLYPLLCKQQNYMFAQLLMHLAIALGCS